MVLVLIVVFIIIVTASDVVFVILEIEAVGCIIVVFLNSIGIKRIVMVKVFLPKQKKKNITITFLTL